MSVLVRAEDVPAVSRSEYFHEALRAVLGPLNIRTGDGNQLPDQILAADVGALRIGELWASGPGGAERSRRHVQLMDADLIKVDVVIHGAVVVEQDGRQAGLHAGDYAFVDLARPARWTNSRSARILAIAFPRQLLPLGPDATTKLSAVGMTADEGPGAIFSSTALQLARHFDNLDVATGTMVSTAMLDLLTVALAARVERGSGLPVDIPQRALVVRIRAFIEEQLADPELTPATVARAHHISLRYLYKLFQPEQTSVAGLIKQRRLERCRRDLLDPSLRHLPVSAIAARWGLMNAAHFARAFRSAYGASPLEYRRLAIGSSLH
jgi:AraC-like DNA-binding protein